MLAKWLDRAPRLLVLNEPTRGVDVGAKREIYMLINNLANEGLSILLISSELPEVLGVSDRVVVMCRGRITGEYVNKNLEQDVLLKAASTVRVEGFGMSRGFMKFLRRQEFIILMFSALVFAVFSIFSENFFTANNVRLIFQQYAVYGICVLGVSLVGAVGRHRPVCGLHPGGGGFRRRHAGQNGFEPVFWRS